MWAGLSVGNVQVSSVLNVARRSLPGTGLGARSEPRTSNADRRMQGAGRRAPSAERRTVPTAIHHAGSGRPTAGRDCHVTKLRGERDKCVKSEAHLLRSRGEAWRWREVSI